MKAIRRIALLLLVGASLTVVLPHRQSHADHRQTYGCRGMGCGGVLMYLIVKGIGKIKMPLSLFFHLKIFKRHQLTAGDRKTKISHFVIEDSEFSLK